MYEYRWDQWILFFFCYSFFGWIFESCYVSLKSRRLVNRGFLRLPLLPLYGTGAVMMLFVSLPVKEHLVLVYISGVAAATLLEYVTGWGMERLFKMRYWDYSNQKWNIKGYICLSSSIAWGFLTIFLTEVVHRPVERLILGLHEAAAYGIVGVVGTLFVADAIESTRAALDLGHALEAMAKLRADLEDVQVQLSLLQMGIKEQAENRLMKAQEEAAVYMAEIRKEADARMNGLKDSSLLRRAEAAAIRTSELKAELKEEIGKLEDFRAHTARKLGDILEKISLLSEQAEKLRDKVKEQKEKRSRLRRFYFSSILNGNQISVKEQYREFLKELREDAEKHKKNSR